MLFYVSQFRRNYINYYFCLNWNLETTAIIGTAEKISRTVLLKIVISI